MVAGELNVNVPLPVVSRKKCQNADLQSHDKSGRRLIFEAVQLCHQQQHLSILT